MKDELKQKLFETFPLTFGYGRVIDTLDFSFGDGWYQTIFDLASKMELLIKAQPQNKQNLYFINQIKEKYAELRIYMYNKTLAMQKLIDIAEEQSSKVCEVCGDIGYLYKTNKNYYCTSCVGCAKQRQLIRVEHE